MLVHQLTPAECHELLSRTHLGRLACARDNQPYVVPIHFSYDAAEHCIYSFSTIGQKVRWMRDNPKVCLEVEDIVDKDHWTSVVIVGRYEEIHQAAAESAARRRAEALFQQRPEWWLPGAARVASDEHPTVVIYRIRLDDVSGRRAARSPATGN